MDFTRSCFYNLKSKKKLFELLYIDNDSYFKRVNKYVTYIQKNNFSDEGSTNSYKERLIEKPYYCLASIQKRIKMLLERNVAAELPNYVLCKKGSSFLDIMNIHMTHSYIISFDISKFFPSVSFDKIVKLFVYKFKTSRVVANILSSILTIDYSTFKANAEVVKYIANINNERNIKISHKHLCTGSSVSLLIAELVAFDMFDEINRLCSAKNISFTAYVDDIHISSNEVISRHFSNNVIEIIKKYGFTTNRKKISVYTPKTNAVIFGIKRMKNSNKLTITLDYERKIQKLISINYDGNFDENIKGMINYIKNIDYTKYNYYLTLYQNKCNNKHINN